MTALHPLGTIQVSALHCFSDLLWATAEAQLKDGHCTVLTAEEKASRECPEAIRLVNKSSGESISVYNWCKEPISTSRILFPLFAFPPPPPSLPPSFRRASAPVLISASGALPGSLPHLIGQTMLPKKKRVTVHRG